MSTLPGLYLALFLLVCAALLLLPFFPAWSEWQRPTDRQPLRLGVGDDSQASLTRLLRQQVTLLQASGQPLVYGSLEQALTGAATPATADQRASASTSLAQTGAPIAVARGCCFQQIEASEIVFGEPGLRSQHGDGFEHVFLPAHPPIAGAQPWGLNGWRVDGDCSIQNELHLSGSLVVTGVLLIGRGARVDGDVKARQGVVIGAGAQVNGSVISDSGVRVFDGAFVGGPLVAATLLQIGADVRLGKPLSPTSVSAAVILVGEGTTVHGCIEATQVGLIWNAA